MSAAVIPPVDSLVAEGAEIDAAIRDSLAALAEGKVSDADVAELRRRRAGIDDRIQGARLREERAEEERRDEERAKKRELLEKLVAEVASFDAWFADQVKLLVATHAMLAQQYGEIVERSRTHGVAQRRAQALIAELGIAKSPNPDSPLCWHEWSQERLVLLCNRKLAEQIKMTPENDNAYRLMQLTRIVGG